ncbi:unnamed protein product [Caretta caretta]
MGDRKSIQSLTDASDKESDLLQGQGLSTTPLGRAVYLGPDSGASKQLDTQSVSQVQICKPAF